MPVEGFTFLADSLAEPLADGGTVDVVVVGPALVAGVVGWIDAGAFHPTPVIGKERFEPDEVVALHDQIAAAGVTAGELGHVLEQMERNLQVMVDDGVLADPVECGHAG